MGKFVYGGHYNENAMMVDGCYYPNFCATRGSVAYNRMGFSKYLKADFRGQNGEMKGKPITSTASKFKDNLDRIYTNNKDKIISVQNPKSIEQVVSKFGNRRGTFIMISKEGVSYSGGSQAKVVYLYVADRNKKRKEENNEKMYFFYC